MRQLTHAVDMEVPVAMRYLPALQAVQVDAPVVVTYWPAGQLVQRIPLTLELKDPAGQAEQDPDPVDEYLPEGHNAHTAAWVTDGAAHVEPSAHESAPQQAYWPEAQLAQGPLRSAGYEAGQGE